MKDMAIPSKKAEIIERIMKGRGWDDVVAKDAELVDEVLRKVHGIMSSIQDGLSQDVEIKRGTLSDRTMKMVKKYNNLLRGL